MASGHIKLHRQITKNVLWQSPELSHLFIHLLLSASYRDGEYEIASGKVITVRRGQLVTGRFKLAAETGIRHGNIWRLLKRLEKAQQIAMQTHNKYSLITVVKYGDYQDQGKNGTTNEQQNAKQMHTVKEYKKKRSKEVTLNPPAPPGVEEVIAAFRDTVNPMIRFGNTAERKAAADMIARLGLPRTLRAAQYAVSIQGQRYSPTITKPTQLLNKYGDLQAHYAKNIKQSEVAKI